MEWQQTNARQRVAIVAGAVLAIHLLLLVAALAALFALASGTPWLSPGDDGAALLARCQRVQDSSARHRCIESVLGAVKQRPQGLRLAAAASAVDR